MARSNSGGLAKSAVLAVGPFNHKQVSVDNQSATINYVLMLFNAATLPANGAVPEFEQASPFGKTIGFDWGQQGERFTVGLVAALSTTAGTLTVATANDGFFQSQYY